MEATCIKLTFDRALKVGEANLLRGAVASAYPKLCLLHNHDGEGYRYAAPLIQYKVIDGNGIIIGLEAGSKILKQIAFDKEEYRFGEDALLVIEREVKVRDVTFGISPDNIRYRFLNPWMALNQDNYHLYVRADCSKQKSMLETILKGNLISVSKGLSYTVPTKIDVKSLTCSAVPIKLKGTPMLGFHGQFVVNFTIPELWGIGKSASRGFGTVKQEASNLSNFIGGSL